MYYGKGAVTSAHWLSDRHLPTGCCEESGVDHLTPSTNPTQFHPLRKTKERGRTLRKGGRTFYHFTTRSVSHQTNATYSVTHTHTHTPGLRTFNTLLKNLMGSGFLNKSVKAFGGPGGLEPKETTASRTGAAAGPVVVGFTVGGLHQQQ